MVPGRGTNHLQSIGIMEGQVGGEVSVWLEPRKPGLRFRVEKDAYLDQMPDCWMELTK